MPQQNQAISSGQGGGQQGQGSNSSQGGVGMAVLPNLLPADSTLNRQGSTTQAEGGPMATGPLGDFARPPGPATAVFGAALFTRMASSGPVAPNPNYLIVPGDNISIKVWGAVESEVTASVDGQGNIFLPGIGPVHIAGTRSGDLQAAVESQVRRIYTQQVQVYAVLLTTNQVGVFVTGFVRTPGRYLGTSTDSIIDYLSMAGGVDPARGSYREISLNRGGREVAKVDLYDFLIRGRLPSIQFQAGDTIVVAKQRALISADGAVRNNFLFEMPSSGRVMSGRELIDLSGPLPSATNAVLRGTRNGQPWSRYANVAELRTLSLQDQDTVTFITDAPAPTVRVSIEGSRIGPSVLVADRDMGLCQLLDYVAVDPALADTGSVYILRPSLAAQQTRSINEALDRLERQLFNATSPTTGVAQIRASEAQLVSSYIQRTRRIQPEGRLVVSDDRGRCADVRLTEGDTIVIPEKSDTVLVSGEVISPQAVVWRPGLTLDQYVEAAGGYTQRGSSSGVMIRRPSGQVILDGRASQVRRGDELIILPELEGKYFQLTSDLLSLIYQTALSARTLNSF
ncbi:polysaccharide biosynthesis/export family protein [Acetobacteraceae bacterium H6797]|nr:polysaccharide biosynthesis/export family protein [Acetobacteraceae bacterium H6797]